MQEAKQLADRLTKEVASKAKELAEAKKTIEAMKLADGLAKKENVSKAQELAEAKKAMELADRLAKEEKVR